MTRPSRPILTVIADHVSQADQQALRDAGWTVVAVTAHSDVLIQGSAVSPVADAAVGVLQEIVSGSPGVVSRDTLALRWMRAIRARTK